MPRVLPLLGVVALAGCGGGGDDRLTKREYEQRVLEIRERFEPEALSLYGDLVVDDPLLPPAECVEKAHELHRVLGEIVAEIEGLRSPQQVDHLQERFLVEARKSVDAVGKLAQDVENGDVSCGQPFNGAAYGLESTKRAERVLEEFRERGYRFGFE